MPTTSNRHTPVPLLTEIAGTPTLYQPVPAEPGTAPDLRKHPPQQGVPANPPWYSNFEGKTAGQRVYQGVPPNGGGRDTTPAPHPSPVAGGRRHLLEGDPAPQLQHVRLLKEGVQ